MKIAILWIELTGYLNACLRELAAQPGVELLVVHRPPNAANPFAAEQFAWLPRQLLWKTEADLTALASELDRFQPDVLLVSGWQIAAYARAARRWRRRAIRVMAMDTTWLGTPRQRLGVLLSPLLVRPLADAIWVPGDRQFAFATRLHFRPAQILRGLYACDYDAFAAVYAARLRQLTPPRAFLFVGRMVAEKGIATLAAAYALYRSRVEARGEAPWPLICCGDGPLAATLRTQPGIDLRGFLQPSELPPQLARASCLILPSTYEPWAVVVQEAAAAGLAILASQAVGAVPNLVHEDGNGFVFPPGDVEQLAHLMQQISQLPDSGLNHMAAVSHQLAQQFTPRLWADTLLTYAANREHAR